MVSISIPTTQSANVVLDLLTLWLQNGVTYWSLCLGRCSRLAMPMPVGLFHLTVLFFRDEMVLVTFFVLQERW